MAEGVLVGQGDGQFPGRSGVERGRVVQPMHVRARVAQLMAGEVWPDGGKPGGLGAAGQDAVEGAQQDEEGFLLGRVQTDSVQAVPTGVEGV